jgi:hypothetical protein
LPWPQKLPVAFKAASEEVMLTWCSLNNHRHPNKEKVESQVRWNVSTAGSHTGVTRQCDFWKIIRSLSPANTWWDRTRGHFWKSLLILLFLVHHHHSFSLGSKFWKYSQSMEAVLKGTNDIISIQMN